MSFLRLVTFYDKLSFYGNTFMKRVKEMKLKLMTYELPRMPSLEHAFSPFFRLSNIICIVS